MRATVLLTCLLIGSSLFVGAALADNGPALTLPLAHWTQGVDEYFMRIDGLPGPGWWHRNTDWFHVLYFRPEVDMPTVLNGQLVPGTIYLTKRVDEFSSGYDMALGGTWHQPWAKIKLVHRGKVVTTVKLEDVWVSSVKLGSGPMGIEPTCVETLGISFGGLTVMPGGTRDLD
jgi:hypothetical protein